MKSRPECALDILRLALGDRPGTADIDVNVLTIPISVPYWVVKFAIQAIEEKQKEESFT